MRSRRTWSARSISCWAVVGWARIATAAAAAVLVAWGGSAAIIAASRTGFMRRQVSCPTTVATRASTRAAAAADRPRVSSAARRAIHTSTSPACTRPHSRGHRCRRSRASATNRCAAWSLIPSTQPSSGMANSATSGVPSPPTWTSRSTPFTPRRASTGDTSTAPCRSTQCAANASSSPCSRRACSCRPASLRNVHAASSPSSASTSQAASSSRTASRATSSATGSA